MLVVLVHLALARWQTSHLGEPLFSRVRDEQLLIYTRDRIVALLNASSGIVQWRQKLKDIVAFDIVNTLVVLGSPQYFYLVDGESGHLLNVTKHDVPDLVDVTINKESIALLGESELHVYNRSQFSWSVQLNPNTYGLNITSTTVICGTTEYSRTNGTAIGNSTEPPVPPSLEFKWSPTILEAYNGSSFLWRIEDPLYGAALLTAISKSSLFLTNATHYLVYDASSQTLKLVGRGHVVSFVETTRGLVFLTPYGALRMNPKNLTIEDYKGKSLTIAQNGLLVNSSGKYFTFPTDCTPLCSAGSQQGSMLAAASCGSKVVAAVVDTNGRVKFLTYVDNAVVGTCWAFDDSLSLSYYRPMKKAAYVNSFGLSNTSQRSFTTESLIVAAGRHHFALANGQVSKIHAFSFHGAIPYQGSEPQYTPDVKGERIQGSWEAVKVLVDTNGCLAVQNYDIHVIQGAADDSLLTMHLTITGGSLVLALFLLFNSYSSHRWSFWQ
jgi:hypothetical protein